AGALAGVDAGTLHLAACLGMTRALVLLRVGGGGEHCAHGGGDESALQVPSVHVRHFLSSLGLRVDGRVEHGALSPLARGRAECPGGGAKGGSSSVTPSPLPCA